MNATTTGGAYKDSTGDLWSADSNYSGGNELSNTKSVSGTPDPALYQNWRAANATVPLTYTFNSIPNSSRTVILDFADLQSTAPGQRVFKVAFNGVTVLSNFDIFQTAGASTALVETFPVTVTTGQIQITFSNVSGRYAIINALAIQ